MKSRALDLIALALVGGILSSCAAASSSSVIPIHDAPPLAKSGGQWLNNTHVLIVGYDAAEPGVRAKISAGAVRLQNEGAYLWDITTGALSRDPRFDNASGLCVHGDHLAYSLPMADAKNRQQITFFHGQSVNLPQEEEGWFNPVNCAVTRTKPAWVIARENGRAVVPLLEEHGYIDRGMIKEWSQAAPLIYYFAKDQKPVALGLDSRQVQAQISYADFLDGYVLVGNRSNTTAAPLWLLRPDGQLDQIFSPEGKAWASLSWPWMALTKQGPLFAALSARGPQSAERGLYLWTRSALLRVADGYFPNKGVVSPDGCRVVVTRQQQGEYVTPSERFKIQVIDLCPGGTTSPVSLPKMKEQCVLEGPTKVSAYGWTRNWILPPLLAPETNLLWRINLIIGLPFVVAPETALAPFYLIKDLSFWLSCGA